MVVEGAELGEGLLVAVVLASELLCRLVDVGSGCSGIIDGMRRGCCCKVDIADGMCGRLGIDELDVAKECHS